MFGKKKHADPKPIVEVTTIPDDFYGGANPSVYQSANKSNAVEKKTRRSQYPGVQKASASAKVAGLFTNRKFLALSFAGLFIVFAAVSALYYYFQSRPEGSEPPAKFVLTPDENKDKTPDIIAPQDISVEPAVNPAIVQPLPAVVAEVPLEFPSAILGDSPDMDKDGLTDVEEDLLKTDPGVPDSDADKYNDGQELFNLYNPSGKEPMKLIESSLVMEYVNPVYGYKLYYPISWALGNVDDSFKDVLFSTFTGENVEVRVFELPAGQNFDDWFGSYAQGQKLGDLKPFESAFKEKGLVRNDNLVYYFNNQKYAYVVLYHTTDSSVVNYRMILQMMARSFRLTENYNALTMPSAAESVAPDLLADESATGTINSESASSTL